MPFLHIPQPHPSRTPFRPHRDSAVYGQQPHLAKPQSRVQPRALHKGARVPVSGGASRCGCVSDNRWPMWDRVAQVNVATPGALSRRTETSTCRGSPFAIEQQPQPGQRAPATHHIRGLGMAAGSWSPASCSSWLRSRLGESSTANGYGLGVYGSGGAGGAAAAAAAAVEALLQRERRKERTHSVALPRAGSGIQMLPYCPPPPMPLIRRPESACWRMVGGWWREGAV